MASALCVQFRPQRQPLFALGKRWQIYHKEWFVGLRSFPSRIAQRQQGRPCFAVSLEEDEEQTQEERRRGKRSATHQIVLHQKKSLQKLPALALLSRLCGELARSFTGSIRFKQESPLSCQI
jgi:hypothetical protein